MGTIKLRAETETVSRLLDSGLTRQEDDPQEAVRKSKAIRARSRELIERSKKLIAASRQKRHAAM